MVAVAVAAFAAKVPDLRAVAAVTGLAMATFVGFLANRFGELTGSADAWSYAMVIGLAAAPSVPATATWSARRAGPTTLGSDQSGGDGTHLTSGERENRVNKRRAAVMVAL